MNHYQIVFDWGVMAIGVIAFLSGLHYFRRGRFTGKPGETWEDSIINRQKGKSNISWGIVLTIIGLIALIMEAGHVNR